MGKKTVLISGASIAGPALAYWLTAYGYDVTLVERAPALRPGGQAVDFKGVAHRAVLRRMGILDEVYRRQTGKTDMVVVDANGAELALMPGDWLGGDVEILRGDLSAILYGRTENSCEYLFGDSIVDLVETATGVDVTFEKGARRTFDLVFGADGIHSRVRRCVFGPESEFVRHLGYYYAVAGAPGSADAVAAGAPPARGRATIYSEPGRSVVRGGAKANQMYIFAAPQLDYSRDDSEQQKAIVRRTFADVGGQAPALLATLDDLDDFYLDSISRVSIGSYVKGRVALVGDAGYGNTLGGFGTGLALVGAYVMAGELAAAGGDHVTAFARYDTVMRRYAKKAGVSNAGAFLAPPTGLRLRLRNWMLNSTIMFGLTLKMTDWFANDIDLPDYPAVRAGRR